MKDKRIYTPAECARIVDDYRDFMLSIDDCDYAKAIEVAKKIPENVRKQSWLGKVSKDIIGDLEKRLGKK
jgi:hypothetical protein